MTRSSIKMTACAIAAAAFLTACGGGGTTPDTTAPTVNITDNVSGTASGDVTFTFTFSEVVTGFEASDVTVTNGTKGTFAMANDGRSATLVVSPPADSSGTIGVSIAAATFADSADNANTAIASANQAFDTTTDEPTPSTNLITNGDFNDGTAGWSGNAANVVTENGNSYFFADVATAGNPWDVNLSYITNIPTANVKYKLTFKASSNRSRTLVAGIGLNQDPWTNQTQTINLTTTEQTFVLDLTSNFASPTSRIIFDMGADTGHVVIDDVMLEIDTSVVVAGPTAAALAPTATAANVVSVFSDAYTNIAVSEWGPDWGPSSARISDGVVAGNNFKSIDMNAGQVFAGINFAGAKFNADTYTTFNMNYWIDTPLSTGQVISIKLSNHDGAAETSAIEHVVSNPIGGSWQTLSVPLNSFTQALASLSRNNIAQLIITAARADTNQPVKIYIDNVYFSK